MYSQYIILRVARDRRAGPEHHGAPEPGLASFRSERPLGVLSWTFAGL